MNEPHRGYIDLPSLHKFDYNTDLHLGNVRAYSLPCCSVSPRPMLTPMRHTFSIRLAIFPPRCWPSYYRRLLDTIFPHAYEVHGSTTRQPKGSKGLARRWPNPRSGLVGDARGVGVGQCKECRGGAPREIFRERSGHWSQGTLYFHSALIGSSVGRAALTILQVDWYTDFYYPFLKRWTERVRGAIANGRGHEKLFFTESIPNEV